MKRLVTIVLLAICFVLSMGTYGAYAMPLTQNCSANTCRSTVIWGNSTTYPIVGAITNMTISDPGLGANDDFLRQLQVWSAVDTGMITTGIEKTGLNGVGTYCHSAHLQYFLTYETSNGVIGTPFCRDIPSSGDKNKQATFNITRNSDNSYDIYISFANGDGACKTGCSLYNIQDPVYHYIGLIEYIHTTWSNSHEVWGSAWGYNQYQDPNSLNFYFQGQANCNGVGSKGCPNQSSTSPTMYWGTLPQNSLTGGEVESCDYDPPPNLTTTFCNYGS